jgi:ABC-type proline/glycine betaine transport system ATPase subunit
MPDLIMVKTSGKVIVKGTGESVVRKPPTTFPRHFVTIGSMDTRTLLLKDK